MVVVNSSEPGTWGLADGLATVRASLAEDSVGLAVEVRWWREGSVDGSPGGAGEDGNSGGGGGLWNWVAGMMISGRVVVVVVGVVEDVVLDGVVGDSAMHW